MSADDNESNEPQQKPLPENKKRAHARISGAEESDKEEMERNSKQNLDGEQQIELLREEEDEHIREEQPEELQEMVPNYACGRQFKSTSDQAERNLSIAKAMVEQHDWLNVVMMRSIHQLPTMTYVIIPPTCHLVETCCTKFRAFLKERGLVMKMVRMTSEEMMHYRPVIVRQGVCYLRCVAQSLEIAQAVLEQVRFSWAYRSRLFAPLLSKEKKPKEVPKKKPHIPTAFNIFSNEMREKLRRNDPSICFGDISVKIGNAWTMLSTAAKSIYHAKAEAKRLEMVKAIQNAGQALARTDPDNSQSVRPVDINPLPGGSLGLQAHPPPGTDGGSLGLQAHPPPGTDGGSLGPQAHPPPDTNGGSLGPQAHPPPGTDGGSLGPQAHPPPGTDGGSLGPQAHPSSVLLECSNVSASSSSSSSPSSSFPSCSSTTDLIVTPHIC